MKNSVYIVDTKDKRGTLIKSKLESLKKTVFDLDNAPKESQNTSVVLFPKSTIPSNINFCGSEIYCFKNIDIPNAKVINLQQNPVFWGKNSLLTAESLLGKIICETPFSLSTCKILVIGFGKTGKSLCKTLDCLAKAVDVFTVDGKEIAESLSLGFNCFSTNNELLKEKLEYEIIINTSSVKLLDENVLSTFNSKYLFDITTVLDLAELEKSGIKSIACPALPSHFCVETASQLILDCILGET